MYWLTRPKSRSLKSRQIFACAGNLGKVHGLLKINLGRVVESYKSPELCSLKFCVFIFNIICCICVKIVNKLKMLNCFRCSCFARSIAVCACFSRIESHDLALSNNVQFTALDVFETNKHSRCDVHL